MKGVAARLGLLVVSLGVALGAGEAVLRGAGYEYHPMRITAGDANDARAYHLFGDQNFVYDPELIWRPRAGFGVFNSLGFRGPEVGSREPALRIATVGDSNTLGWAGADGANWPGELGRLLSAAGVDAEVVNAGVWGYSSHQGVPRTREVLALEPDLVLISFGANDAHHVSRSDADFSNRSLARRRLENAVGSLRSAQLLTAALDRLAPPSGEPRRRVALDDYRRNLETMIDDVRRAGAVPVLLTRPYVGIVLGDAHWKHVAPDYNLATVEVGERLQVPVVDVFSFFKERDALFADESHFTEEGHRQAAAVVFEHLRPWLATR